MRSATRLGVVLVLLAGLSAPPLRADPDTNLQARVQQALLGSRIPNAENIQVKSFNGEIDLAGVVFTERAKGRAASVVTAVPGVTSVQNSLEVQPRANDDDDATTARVQAALAAAHLPDVGPIEVNTFNGKVDLTGIVYSTAARAQVIQVAGGTRGVGSIGSSELEIRDPPQ